MFHLTCIDFYGFRYFAFGFEGWIWVLIAPVPDIFILFTFTIN